MVAACGAREDDWGPVREKPAGWLRSQRVFCLTSPYGAIDVFRAVRGLDSWQRSCAESVQGVTADGVRFRGLSDADMLKCQLAVPSATLESVTTDERRWETAGHPPTPDPRRLRRGFLRCLCDLRELGVPPLPCIPAEVTRVNGMSVKRRPPRAQRECGNPAEGSGD